MRRLSETPRAGHLRDALAEALEDPSLELVYWLPERRGYVDFRGRDYELPDRRSEPRDSHGRARRRVRGGDHPRRRFREAKAHVEAVGAAASLALMNERLEAELRAKVDELRRSRERMLRIGLEERRRLERDLHDGAQQRLVSMALNIRIARAKLNEDPLAADQLLESRGPGARLGARGAARAGARHPPRGAHGSRARHGARDAREPRAGAGRARPSCPPSGCPRRSSWPPTSWWPRALTNVAKYAKATHATVGVERENGRLVVEVADDGVGGADPEIGTGLRGLADRLAVLEGRLEIDSEQGRGTTLRAQIPCA